MHQASGIPANFPPNVSPDMGHTRTRRSHPCRVLCDCTEPVVYRQTSSRMLPGNEPHKKMRLHHGALPPMTLRRCRIICSRFLLSYQEVRSAVKSYAHKWWPASSDCHDHGRWLIWVCPLSMSHCAMAPHGCRECTDAEPASVITEPAPVTDHCSH